MNGWLDPVREALEDAPTTVDFFFRDDDAGWADARLHALLAVFERAAAPIDLAVIPCALSRRLARELASLKPLVRVHQHGYAHADHEPVGRKCEFGPARDEASQRADIDAGRRLLADPLEQPLDPIFTPPWNRCTETTGRILVELGFGVLSRDASVPPLGLDRLAELPIALDWFAHRRGVRLSRDDLGRKLAALVRVGGPVGVMLHHAVTDDDELRSVAELVAALERHDAARFVPMAELALAAAAR
ncbi:MAG TPA: hypothetical protein VFA66_02525 [Gaiellaceae bacterium]|nr:hypothetical protein [Gaiellaceae bacterium]